MKTPETSGRTARVRRGGNGRVGAYRRTGEGFPGRTRELLLEADGVLLGAIDGAILPAGVVNPLHLLRRVAAKLLRL